MDSRPQKKILIVDDDLADVYLLRKTLRSFGLENVQSVVTAEEASKYIVGLSPYEDRWIPDVVFIDLKMTGADGFQLIGWIKKNPLFKNIPMIAFSGSSNPEDAEKAIELGAKAFYQKTGEATRLRAIVEEILSMAP